MKQSRNMKVTGYKIVKLIDIFDGNDVDGLRLYRGKQTTTLFMSEIDYIVRKYNITQIDLIRMVHLEDIIHGILARDFIKND